jgi:hypothetical protein
MAIIFLPIEVELGILGGLSVATAGYFQACTKKSEDGTREKFSIDKFFATVAIGAFAGGALAFTSIGDEIIYTFLASAGIVAIVEALIKSIIRLQK